MKRLLFVLALWLAPFSAFAQCNGVFPNNTVCGNITGAGNLPRPTNPTAFLGAAGGTAGQIQYNNAGALGGFTMAGDCTTNTSTGVITCRQPFVPTRTALKATNTAVTTQLILTEAGRTGPFVFTAGNYTAAIAADTNEGIYIKADAIAASAGAWVRQFDWTNFQSSWFGALADHSTDSTAIINSMMVVGNIQNTNASPGAQTAIYLNIQGGVRFASQNLSWLPSADWIFVYLRYFANSDTTKGVNTGGGGSNELMTMSVNSGYPGDPTGAYVMENIFAGPLHPALGVNLNKNVNNSIYLHSGSTQSIQPNFTLNAATATPVVIKEENFERFFIKYLRFGTNDAVNGVYFSFHERSTELVCSGCAGVSGWGAAAWGANVPANGAVVRGMTTDSRYIVTGGATDIIETSWLTGTAIPGELLMNERAIFKGSISGTTLTVSSMIQGSGNIAVGQTIVGMYPQSGITTSTTISSLGTGTGGTGTYIVNNSQTLAETQVVSGYVSSKNIAAAGVVNTDTSYDPMRITMAGDLVFPTAAFSAINACSATNKGALRSISDSSTVVWGATITGGGADQVLGYCNGTNWTVSAK